MEKEFAELTVGDKFRFPMRKDGKQYTKVEEQRRPYTPEAFSNACFDWQTIDPRNNEIISEGRTYFYVCPTEKVDSI
jgi:hypothetical protein